MKIAYTVWTWMKDEFGRDWVPTDHAQNDFEQAVADISGLGYDSIENFNFIIPVYEDKPEELTELLKKYNLEFVNIYQTLSEGYDKDLESAKRGLKFLQRHKIPYMNVQAGRVPMDKPVSYEMLDEFVKELHDIGTIAKEHGVQLCLHPHARTLVETEWQLDYVASKLDFDKVKFCLDTCHLVLGGMQPVDIFKKYVDEIAYVHFKDVLGDIWTPFPESPTQNARALGLGIVDYPAILKVLTDNGYDGVLCVEVDYPIPDSFTAAKISREYIRNTLGL